MSAVEASTGNADRAVALRREALIFAAGDIPLAAAVHQWLAIWSGDERAKERHARASLDLAEQLDDDFLRAGALAVLARLRFAGAEPDAVALAEQAHELESRARRADRAHPSAELAHLLAWARDRDLVASFVLVPMLVLIGHFETARALLDDLERETTGRNEPLLERVLGLRSMLELRAGRWVLANEVGRRQREIATEYQLPDWAGPYVVRAEVALHRGELEEARRLAAEGRELAVGDPGWLLHDFEALVGLADRADGAPAEAVAAFTAAEAAAEARALREPAFFWWRADFAEALLELGRVDEAGRLLDAWESDARRLGRDRILAHITRCRGLVAAASGDVQVALTTLERAVAEADEETDPFGHARALLALGVTRRRAREKRRAREAIAAALAGFEGLGEVIWTRRARAELGQISGRRREEGLTAAERRVAALVAHGRTNREVAAALSLGERTVETHLTHIYAKLGVRTRTELARVYEPAS